MDYATTRFLAGISVIPSGSMHPVDKKGRASVERAAQRMNRDRR